MGNLMNSAKIRYEFLNENVEIKTKEVKKYTKSRVEINENFYIPNFLSKIYEVNSCELLTLGIKQMPHKKDNLVLINYGIDCNYKNEFFMNQHYIKSFSKTFYFNSDVNLKHAKLIMSGYKLVTKRFIKVYLYFDF